MSYLRMKAPPNHIKPLGGGFSSPYYEYYQDSGDTDGHPLFSSLPSCERGDNGSVGPVGLPVSSISSLSSLGSVAWRREQSLRKASVDRMNPDVSRATTEVQVTMKIPYNMDQYGTVPWKRIFSVF